MAIDYKLNKPISSDQFIELLHRSTLATRRPIEDRKCIDGMILNSNLMITAWDGNKLVGIARSMTDFHYACYLSDLAVDARYKNLGIGKKLLAETQKALGARCKLILVAAPNVNSYYEHVGFENNPRCWILNRDKNVII